MRLIRYLLLIGFISLGLCFSAPADEVKLSVVRMYQLEDKPVDIAVSHDGEKIYTLTNKGELLIFTVDRHKTDKIFVGQSVTGIEIGRNEDLLYLFSADHKTINDRFTKTDTQGDRLCSGAALIVRF